MIIRSRFHRENSPNGYGGRVGAVLICVLVVLLLVGLLAMQTTQTMLLLRRADSRRGELRQARELLELGRAAVGEESIEESIHWEIELSVPNEGQVRKGQIEVKLQAANEANIPPSYRILAKFPGDSDRAVTVSWDSSRQSGEVDEN